MIKYNERRRKKAEKVRKRRSKKAREQRKYETEKARKKALEEPTPILPANNTLDTPSAGSGVGFNLAAFNGPQQVLEQQPKPSAAPPVQGFNRAAWGLKD
jgi:hypothetical protein